MACMAAFPLSDKFFLMLLPDDIIIKNEPKLIFVSAIWSRIHHFYRPLGAGLFTEKTADWIMCSLPINCRVLSAFAKDIRGGETPLASDHKPVVAMFELYI